MSTTTDVNLLKGRSVQEVLNFLINEFWQGMLQHHSHVAIINALGLKKLSQEMSERISDEPDTIRKLSDRLLDIDGVIDINLRKCDLGSSLREILERDLTAQKAGGPIFAAAIAIAEQNKDIVTKRLIEDIAIDEEAHLLWLKNELSLLDRLGDPFYISLKT